MHIISARNVHDALPMGLSLIHTQGKIRNSRNGTVLVMPVPVTTMYERPKERVMFHPERNANPFFHFMEALWMLAGRDDVEFLTRFNKNMNSYSDDGVSFHGAYGFRWRHNFGFDQLSTIAEVLTKNPEDRRAVLQIWDPMLDLNFASKDIPCNICVTFRVNDGYLDMHVFNRSNDIIWGAYGANAVHFSMLQELLACWIDCSLGTYYQISTNYHAYRDIFDKVEILRRVSPGFSPYEVEGVEPLNMINVPVPVWLKELNMFLEEGAAIGFQDPFFKRVAIPLLLSWQAWKEKDTAKAIALAETCIAQDWRKAAVEWLERRNESIQNQQSG